MGQLLVVELCNNLRQPELLPGPDGQYFTTANLWTWEQMLLTATTVQIIFSTEARAQAREPVKK
jgi:hypothetical protein